METTAPSRQPVAASRAGRGTPRDRVWLLLLPAVGFLLLFYGYPVVRLLTLSIFDPDFTLKNYEAALTSPVYVAVLGTTLKISLQTTLLSLVMGYPLAYLLSTTSEKARRLLIIAVVLPYFTSILVRSYAWLVILGRHGILNEAMVAAGLIDQPVKMIFNTTGVVVGMTHIMLPIMVLALYAVMRGINMDFLKVSESLGANQVQTVLRVYFPLSLPGIGAGCLLVFIFSVGFYITPALLGGLKDTMLSMLIATQIQELLRWGFAGALSLILLVVTLCIFLAFNRVMGLDRIWGGHVIRDQDTAGGPSLISLASLRRLRTSLGIVLFETLETAIFALAQVAALPFRMITALANRLFGRQARHQGILASRRLGIVFVSAIVLAFLLVPIALLFPVSFTNSLFLEFPPSGFSLQWYRELVDTTYWTSATWLSLRVAPVSMILAVILGTLGAIALARGQFPLKNVGFMFILSPIIVPVIVTAVALYYFYAQLGLVGSYWGLVIGHTIGSIPVVVVMVAASLKGFDVNLEYAAMSLGASPIRAFLQITLPIIRPAIIVSAFFAFIHSFDEVVIASFFGGATNATLPMRMWVDVRQDIKPTLAAVSTLLITFTVLMLLATDFIQRRRQSDANGTKP